MPSSNSHTPGHDDLLMFDDPGALRPVDQAPATLDRTILGIPDENDEYTRGLIFSFDPSTGQPSTSEESEDPIHASTHEPSISSNNTGSTIVYTPQSGSDVPAGSHSHVVSPKSVRSSDSGSSQGKADRPSPPSISGCATFGTSTASASPGFAMEGVIWPAAEALPSQAGDMNLDQDDINFLQGEMQKTEQVVIQRKGTRLTRRPKSGGTRHDPIGSKASINREKKKLMRQIGVCLPCMVNHEQVSRCLICSFQRLIRSHSKCDPDPGPKCPKCIASKIQKTPCVRPHLSEAMIYRKGNKFRKDI